jgi:hypothetical protein
MSNTTGRLPALSSLNLGSGLIEIAALTALIGSTTVESLMLGNQGAAGLVWGTMSVFGALSAIKACISATTPGWLRETLGVRTKEIDAALGLSLNLDSKGSRSRGGGGIGLACKVESVSSLAGVFRPGSAGSILQQRVFKSKADVRLPLMSPV